MDYSKIKFGVELTDAALHQLSFLHEVDRYPALFYGPVVTQAIFRYENLWLPLAAKHALECLAAPLDIEWIWHCHMLSPLLYQKDCHVLVGCIIDHKLMTHSERSKSLEKAHKYWQEMYPNDPWQIDLHGENVNPKYTSTQRKIYYDVAAAVSRQKVFFYQVSLPHYEDHHFLQSGVIRYKKYLYMKKHNPGHFLVPCYDIDLIWHSHQLHPLIYKQDTEELLGKTFNHDDSVNDRSPGSKLATADLDTREVWKNTFNESFSMYGAMYRGDPPAGKLYKMGAEDVFVVSTKQATVILDKVKIENVPQTMKHFRLNILTSANNRDVQSVAIFKSPKQEWQGKYLANFVFDTKLANCLTFRLQEKTGFACFGSKVNIGENQYQLMPMVETQSSGNLDLNGNLSLTGPNQTNGLNVTFNGSLSQSRVGACLLFLQPGTYANCVMPETVEQLWGPVPLPPLQPGVQNNCEVASHK